MSRDELRVTGSSKTPSLMLSYQVTWGRVRVVGGMTTQLSDSLCAVQHPQTSLSPPEEQDTPLVTTASVTLH